MVERLWVEVNARVNYPIKSVLVDMLDNHLDNRLDKFCVSSMWQLWILVGVNTQFQAC